jgi:hypothetical protein
MEHAVPDRGRLRTAYIVAADAIVVYTVDDRERAVRVVFLSQDPPEYMS